MLEKAYKEMFERYAEFGGRTSRAMYWWAVLANFLVSWLVVCVARVLDAPALASSLYSLVLFIPGLALSVRRMHDIDKSGLWIFINLLPVVGTIWYFVLCVRAGNPMHNQWGENPSNAD